jgi:hypothetical protein
MTRKPRKSPKANDKAMLGLGENDFDPGAKLCGHAPRHERHHYLGGGLWVCFECFAKLLTGRSPEAAPCK